MNNFKRTNNTICLIPKDETLNSNEDMYKELYIKEMQINNSLRQLLRKSKDMNIKLSNVLESLLDDNVEQRTKISIIDNYNLQ